MLGRTGDVTIATDLGVLRSTARGWLRRTPPIVVSLDVTRLSEQELHHEVVRLRVLAPLTVGDARLRRYGSVSYSPDSVCGLWCVPNVV